jgi:hypothetical protein
VAGEPTAPAPSDGTQQAELGVLLAGAVRAVVDAQDVLDEHARQNAASYLAAPPGSLVMPPLWYAFDSVSVDIQLSSEVVRRAATADRAAETHLLCRTLNPVTAGLFGYSASTGTRVRVALAPQRFIPSPAQPQDPEVPKSPT